MESAQAEEFDAARAVWAVVPANTQADIDDEVVRGRLLPAIVALRDRGGIAPAPDLLLGRAVLAYRRDVLIGASRGGHLLINPAHPNHRCAPGSASWSASHIQDLA